MPTKASAQKSCSSSSALRARLRSSTSHSGVDSIASASVIFPLQGTCPKMPLLRVVASRRQRLSTSSLSSTAARNLGMSEAVEAVGGRADGEA